jgi:magnesium-transporting ATPase (P-type)
VLENFEDHILRILIAAAVVSLLAGYFQNGLPGLIEGSTILMSIGIIVTVTSCNNYVKEKQF